MAKIAKITLHWPDSIPRTQFSEQFLQGMLDRLAVAYYNYGPTIRNFPEHYDALKSMKARVKRYRATRNTEWLMDVGNFAMIEFMYPKLPKAHFRPTSKEESPGSVLNDGRVAKGKEHYDPEQGDRLKVRSKRK